MKTTVFIFGSHEETTAFIQGVEFVNDPTITFTRGVGDYSEIVAVNDEDDAGEIEIREMSE